MDQAKHECIVVSALKCFGRFGFKKASVDDIAKDAGVAKGTVYLAAENKEDLLYQALLHDLREWNAQTAKLIDPRMDALEILALLARAGIDSLGDHPLIKQLFEGDLHAMLPRWCEQFDELTHLGRRNTVEVLTLGIKQGRFRPNLDVEATAVLLMDLQVSTMLFHNRETPDREARLMKRFTAAMSLLENGLTGPTVVPVAAGPKPRLKTPHA